MNKLISYLFDDYRKQKNALLFKNLLYLFLIIKCVFWLLNFDILFGEHAVSITYEHTISPVKKLAYFIYFHANPDLALLCIFTLLTFALISLLNKRSYLFIDLAIYLLVLNLNIRVFTTTTAGESLVVNLCFLSAWLRKDFNLGTSVYDQLKVVFHNVSFYALALQVCIVYGYSAWAKWYDADWLSGEAVYLTSKAFHYSRSFIVDHVDSFHALTVGLTYLVLMYQTLFPLLVWFKSLKKYFLLIGIIMHVYIAFVLGLFFFGMIMTLTYVLFYDLDKSKNIS